MVAPKPARPAVLLFVGEDRFSKEKALRELIDSLFKDPSNELDYKIFHGADADPAEVLDHISTLPFTAGTRLVVIKETEKIDAVLRAGLIRYIHHPSRSTCLVLDAADISVLNGFEEAARQITVRRFAAVSGKDLTARMRDILAARGKKLEPEAAAILRELQGGDLLSLQQELEKLVAYTGQRKVITAGDVEEVSGRSLMRSAFDITGAIDGRKTEEAIRICSDLGKTGKREYEIIGILSWHLKRMLRAKLLQAKGETVYRIAGILRVGRQYQDEFFGQVAALTAAQLKARIAVLLEADLEIKRATFDPRMVLEFAVVRLCFCQG